MSTINNETPIGFFDSGVGGLTVLNKVKSILPNEKYIFYGDTLHVPYGDKTKEQLLSYSKNILDFFCKKNCKAVVMACNTTSSLIYNDIKDMYPFKLYPVVQSVARVLSALPVEKIGVFATKATIESNAYQNEINRYNKNIKVYGQYCPEWVKIVENNKITDSECRKIIKSDLDKMLNNHPQKIILGCTHYPFLKDVLASFAPNLEFIDPAIFLASYIKDDLEKASLLSKSIQFQPDEFYVSDNPSKFKIAAKMFYELKEEPILLNF